MATQGSIRRISQGCARETPEVGLKVKGDGLRFPPDNYLPNTTTSWGQCPACQYFPAPVRRTTGLKACVVDQTEDPSAGE